MEAEKPEMETVEVEAAAKPIELKGRRPRSRKAEEPKVLVEETPTKRYRVVIEVGLFDNEQAARSFIEEHYAGHVIVYVPPEDRRERNPVALHLDDFRLEPLAS